MSRFFDPVIDRIDKFARGHLDEVFESCRPFALVQAVQPPPLRSIPLVDSNEIVAANRRILDETRSICGEHSLFTLLIVARRIPHPLVERFLSHTFGIRVEPSTATFAFGEAMTLATNQLLASSTNDLSVTGRQDHYRLSPSHAEIRAAIRLVLLAARASGSGADQR